MEAKPLVFSWITVPYVVHLHVTKTVKNRLDDSGVG